MHFVLSQVSQLNSEKLFSIFGRLINNKIRLFLDYATFKRNKFDIEY